MNARDGGWKGADLHFCVRRSAQRVVLAMATWLVSPEHTPLTRRYFIFRIVFKGSRERRHNLGEYSAICG